MVPVSGHNYNDEPFLMTEIYEGAGSPRSGLKRYPKSLRSGQIWTAFQLR